MGNLLSRRAALTAGLGAPLLMLGREPAAAQSPGELLTLSSTGPFQVTELGILIGLLLPAVQRVRQPFRLRFLDSAGLLKLEIALPAVQSGPRQTAFFRVFANPGPIGVNGDAANGVPVRVLNTWTGEVFDIGTDDGILIGLLLPAVQRNGLPAVQLAASAFTGGVRTGAEPGFLLPFVEQDNLVTALVGTARRHYFIGPIQLTQGGDSALIGMLLPAVQKVRSPAQMLFLDSKGGIVANALLPAVQKDPAAAASPFFDARFEAGFADGSVRIVQKVRGGDDVVIGQGGQDGILIGLLLPAVQTNGAPAGLVGGTLRLGGAHYQFEGISSDADPMAG